MNDVYRKFRSMLKRPVWLTATDVAGTEAARTDVDADEEIGVETEAPDRSHVAPPPVDTPPRDEAIELLERRLDVMAGRADRLERGVEALSPVNIDEMPTRSEYRAIADRLEQDHKRLDELTQTIASLHEAEGRNAQHREEARATMADLTAGKAKLEERLRNFAEELADLRASSASLGDAVRALQGTINSRASLQTAALTRRLAGVYTLAIVALMAAILTLTLQLFR